MPFAFLATDYMKRLETGDPHVTAFHKKYGRRLRWVFWSAVAMAMGFVLADLLHPLF